jgi:hypothetical protein
MTKMQGKMNRSYRFLKQCLIASLVVIFSTIASAQWSTLDLSEPKDGVTAIGLGSKVYFAGGGTSSFNINARTNKIEIFDIKTRQWSIAQLSQARQGMAAVQIGGKLLFASGDYKTNVDIYDTLTNQWTVRNLPEGRNGLAGTTLNSKAYFGGGYDGSGFIRETVYIFDTTTNAWTTKALSVARSRLTAASVGDKVIFAGGEVVGGYSKVVDIYNTTTNVWSTAELSEARSFLKSATIGSKVFFVGGLKRDATGTSGSNVVDIYDNSTGLWTRTTLATARLGHAVAVLGSKLYVAGGDNYLSVYHKSVEIYDANLGQWQATQQLSSTRSGLSGVSAAGYLFFAGGDTRSALVSTIDVTPTIRVSTKEFQKKDIAIYPSSASDYIVCQLAKTQNYDNLAIDIVDMTGRVHPVKSLLNKDYTLIDISHLPVGVYKLRAFEGDSFWIGSFIKK